MLTAEQMAEIMQRYRERVIAEQKRCDAIRSGKIKPPPPTTTWQISDRD